MESSDGIAQGDPEQAAYDALRVYTLRHPDPAFIHQHVVDAYAAQHADSRTKPITLVFALVGLSLHLEKGYSGRQVQQAHMRLAKRRKPWPPIILPEGRGSITVANLVRLAPGSERDAGIDAWCSSVWEAYAECHAQIKGLIRDENL